MNNNDDRTSRFMSVHAAGDETENVITVESLRAVYFRRYKTVIQLVLIVKLFKSCTGSFFSVSRQWEKFRKYFVDIYSTYVGFGNKRSNMYGSETILTNYAKKLNKSLFCCRAKPNNYLYKTIIWMYINGTKKICIRS